MEKKVVASPGDGSETSSVTRCGLLLVALRLAGAPCRCGVAGHEGRAVRWNGTAKRVACIAPFSSLFFVCLFCSLSSVSFLCFLYGAERSSFFIVLSKLRAYFRSVK